MNQRDAAAGTSLPPTAVPLRTWQELLLDGHTPGELSRSVRTAERLRLTKGVYVDGETWRALDPAARHITQARALLLTRSPGWHLAGRTAAVAHRLTLLGELPSRPQLVRAPARASDKSSSRFDRLATLPPRDVCLLGSCPSTTMARSVVDVARGETAESALVVADSALRAGMHKGDLEEVVARCSTWPGGPQARRIVALADGLAESAFESISRLRMHQHGLPAPELQVEVYLGGRLLGRTDFLWRGLNVIGEADGRGKYLDDPRRGYTEKLRDEALQDAGFVTVHWSWADAMSGHPLVAKLLSAMARGQRHQLDPLVRFMTTSLPQPMSQAA